MSAVPYALLVFTLVLGLFTQFNLDKLKIQAIERGYALHCPADGQWAWKGECQ